MKYSNENTVLIMSISCVAAMGAFLFGFDTGVINGTIGGLRLAFNLTLVASSFNVASTLLGCAVGAFFSGRLADIYGRRFMMIIAAVLFILSAWGSGIADTSNVFIFYRMVGGFAVGSASILVPMYIAEVVPARYRGAYAALQQVAINVGLFVVFMSNYLLVHWAGTSINTFWLGYEAWRWMLWAELLPAFIFLFTLFFVPESPRYLVVREKNKQALVVLTKLYGQFFGEAKLMEISLSLSADHKPRLSDLKNPVTGKVRRIVWIGIGIAAFQQFMGINVVFYYGAILWEVAGFSESDALLINVISAALSIGACVFTILFIDRWGRRPFLLIGSTGIIICLLLLVFVFYQATPDIYGVMDLGHYDTLALIAANAYVFFFNLSWGPVMWVILGEMFPNQIRGSGLAVTGFVHWIANFIITMSFPLLLNNMGLVGAYAGYSLFAFLSIIFVYRYLDETKGKELEEMSM
ncbi:sugar porter family MFS transporter [Shewanella surugensis]|uniref:Sugar porter family MFS transporter n=1 Tax=Shewanella surugensis TaxID=212020 RepID=A0ABT0L893_9GAMM|nr:sugar porter family MFS transporter [Shewanella surugensis]MCL1123918.1 sugar porter family MFS transporter [Shewanella surugensis]